MNVPTQPMMNPGEVEAFRKVIESVKPRRVLEWGAGASTLYWPKLFPAIEWLAVEHDYAWAAAVQANLQPNTRLMFLPFPDYYRLDEGTFDLIIVDGRERVRCLDAARKLLNPGGVVLLHDYSRRRYSAWRNYYCRGDVLVPATNGKDPRGLMRLSDPTPDEMLPEFTPQSRGAMYLCWGGPACEQAAASLKSLRSFVPAMPAVILGDDETAKFFEGAEQVRVISLSINPFTSDHMFGFKAGRVKPLLARYSPFEFTLYVDADTAFKRSPEPGFALLDRWDFVIAEAETRSLAQTFPDNKREAQETAARLGTPHLLYHNSGLFFWRANRRTLDLFRLWSDEWHRYEGWDEQIALLRALLVSDALWLNVPYTWNCRGPQEAWLVYHRFAGRSARKYGGLNVEVIPHPRPMPPPLVPIVRVEVAPGRFVQVHKGNEQKAKDHYQRLIMSQRKARTKEAR